MTICSRMMSSCGPLASPGRDGDIVQVDGPVPLAGPLGAQVRVHLPLHTAQIEALAGA
jgi:hypothetical protein